MSKNFNPKKRANFFEKILIETPSTNTFDLSFENKLSMNMGDLVPVMCQEVVPGDKFQFTEEHLIRTAPLVFPTMHRCNVELYSFFVPNRLLWDKFEEYQAYNTLNDLPFHPYVGTAQGQEGDPLTVEVGSLADYLGVPTTDTDLKTLDLQHPYRKLNVLPFAAYNKIISDYFRDQNITEDEFEIIKADDIEATGGRVDAYSNVFQKESIKKSAWQKDYFTSALPFAQKGTEVVLPLGETADLIYTPSQDGSDVRDAVTGALVSGTHSIVEIAGQLHTDDLPTSGQFLKSDIDVTESHKVDLENATGASVNALRYAIRLQEFFERNARAGTRYIEQMLAKFGVRISDARAHRSELIGKSKSYISFSEVLQTSQTETTPLGQQAGHGLSINKDFLTNYYCEEHGWIMVIARVLPDTSYHQGIPRHFIKNDITDYYDPMFANLGEDVVYNWELFADTPTNFNGTFGYQSRYAHMKYNLSQVHGEFRTTMLDFHMSRNFENLPNLNSDFVYADPTHRIFADLDPNNHKLFCYFYFNVTAKRKIPFYSTPSITAVGT